MYHRKSFYPEITFEVDSFNVERKIVDSTTGVETIAGENVTFADSVEFNPSFTGLHPESFSINSAVKSGAPLKPSPSIRVMDMSASDMANKVFNEKIAKK